MLNAKRTSIRDLLLKVKNPISESAPLRKKTHKPQSHLSHNKGESKDSKAGRGRPGCDELALGESGPDLTSVASDGSTRSHVVSARHNS